MTICKGKYTMLEHPEINSTALMVVKVLALYDNPKYGKLVKFRYNWPFPITTTVTESKFISWVATPREQRNDPTEQ